MSGADDREVKLWRMNGLKKKIITDFNKTDYLLYYCSFFSLDILAHFQEVTPTPMQNNNARNAFQFIFGELATREQFKTSNPLFPPLLEICFVGS